jgi:WD40 repeat protein
VQWAVFSPDGEKVLSGAGDKTVRVWSAKSGELLQTIEDRDPYRVAWSPDGTYWVIGGHDGALRFRDASTGALLEEKKVHSDRIYEIVFTQDGLRFGVASGDRKASIWDAAKRELLFAVEGHDNDLSAIAFSPDGKWMLTVESDIYVHVRRAADGARVHSLRLPEQARWSQASFSPDGLTIITRSFDGGVRTWHATSGMMLSAFDAQVKGKLFHSAIRADGREIVTVGHAGSANVWSLPESPGYRILPLGLDRRVHVHPSIVLRGRDRVVTSEIDGHLTLWDSRSARAIVTREVPGDVYSIADVGGRVAVAGTMPESLPPKIFDLEKGERIAELSEHEKMVYNLHAANDTVVTSSYDGKVRVYRDGKLELTVPIVEVLRLSSVAIAPDGKTIAVADENGKLYLIDRESGAIRKTIAAHDTWIQDVEFSADSTRIVTGGRQDHTAKVWDARSGAHQLTIVAHVDNMARASFSPDGHLLATCALDHSAKIWDSVTGDLLRIIHGPSYTCEFSDDGTELYTTGYHGYAVIWDLRTDERSADAIAKYVAERSPWRLADGRLEAK